MQRALDCQICVQLGSNHGIPWLFLVTLRGQGTAEVLPAGFVVETEEPCQTQDCTL